MIALQESQNMDTSAELSATYVLLLAVHCTRHPNFIECAELHC
jgi:hypothetical protein